MSAIAPPVENPVMRRLSRLRGQWNDFAQEPERRLLRWLVHDNEHSLIFTWLNTEIDERTANCPDVLVALHAPFRSDEYAQLASAEPYSASDDYATALRTELNAHLAAAKLPTLSENTPCRPASLLADCAKLWRDHRGRLEFLVLVLSPQEVTNLPAFTQWLNAAVAACPAELRLLVLDDAATPALDSVEQQAPTRVRSIAAGLEVSALLEELSHQGGNTAAPGGRFRQRFLQMNAALTTGDLAKAERYAKMAQAVAQEQQWPQLEIAVLVAMGAGAMNKGRLLDALLQYRNAEKLATTAEAAGDPLGPQLVVKTRLAMGAVLVTQGEHAQAAALYESVTARAQASCDPLLLLECLRMASFCHQSSNDVEPALNAAERGIAAAEALDAESRAASSLSHLETSLHRLAADVGPESLPRLQTLLRRIAALLHVPSVGPSAAVSGAHIA